MNTLTIWWIDDQVFERASERVTSRIESPRHPALRKIGLHAKLIKCGISDGNWNKIETDLAALKSAKRPDLLIIDQRLGNVHKAKRLGTSLAVSLRAQAADVPIVLISAAEIGTVFSEQRKEVIDFFELNSIQSGERIPDLYSIALGFHRLIDAVFKVSPNKKRIALLDLLAVPGIDRELFQHCIPREFAQPWDEETPHTFARWIWHDLIGSAGFLYDELSIATLLGVDVSVLPHLGKKLAGCEYDGAFASPIRKRWWVSLVGERVRKLTMGSVAEPLWRLGRTLVPKQHLKLSRAHGHTSTDLVPDCVAYVDGLHQKRKPARTEDTVKLPYDRPAPGFEPVRIFRKKT